MSGFPDIPEGHEMVLLPPSHEAWTDAQRLAADLTDIATGRWLREGTLPSQSDRLVVLAARCGEIAGLLRARWEVQPKKASS